jgi:hypothetical protein
MSMLNNIVGYWAYIQGTYAHINSLPGGYTPGTLKKHDSNTLIPPPSPGKCVSQTALPLGLRIK